MYACDRIVWPNTSRRQDRQRSPDMPRPVSSSWCARGCGRAHHDENTSLGVDSCGFHLVAQGVLPPPLRVRRVVMQVIFSPTLTMKPKQQKRWWRRRQGVGKYVCVCGRTCALWAPQGAKRAGANRARHKLHTPTGEKPPSTDRPQTPYQTSNVCTCGKEPQRASLDRFGRRRGLLGTGGATQTEFGQNPGPNQAAKKVIKMSSKSHHFWGGSRGPCWPSPHRKNALNDQKSSKSHHEKVINKSSHVFRRPPPESRSRTQISQI